jgi:hypothetical protein
LHKRAIATDALFTPAWLRVWKISKEVGFCSAFATMQVCMLVCGKNRGDRFGKAYHTAITIPPPLTYNYDLAGCRRTPVDMYATPQPFAPTLL